MTVVNNCRHSVTVCICHLVLAESLELFLIFLSIVINIGTLQNFVKKSHVVTLFVVLC